VNRSDRRDYAVRARIVVLAASACETARLLLNSTSGRFPDGLANSSGVVGRYLTDSTGLGVSGPHPEDGARRAAQRGRPGGAHLYMPWWLDNKNSIPARLSHRARRRKRSAPGSVHGRHPALQRRRRLRQVAEGRLPPLLRRDGQLRRPRRDDPERRHLLRDRSERRRRLRHPVLRFHAKFSEHEINQAKHMQETFREIIHEMGGTPTSPMPSREQLYGLEPVGRIIHEVGTTRMGNDQKTSVLNANCQAHDVKNLFVADAGPFVSNAHKNCTWTILALSMRTSEFIAQQRNQGTL
jgi:Choline dehydrogenase and related flavoproteins